MIFRRWLIALAVLLTIAVPVIVHSVEREDAHTVGCLPKTADKAPASACALCHKDAAKRLAAHQHRPCSPYCSTCHKKEEMDRHHPVGTELEHDADDEMPLTAKKEIACVTCHNMSQPRYDTQRWKATSLFDRLFRNEKQHKTYFLSMKNDKGQLCLTCH
ncbi:MAG: hypothetical protein WCI39_02030 [Gallionellaceae bacterium]